MFGQKEVLLQRFNRKVRGEGYRYTMASLFLLMFSMSATLAAKYEPLPDGVKNGGSISGVVKFEGTPPAPEMLKVDTNVEICGSQQPSQELLVNADGGIKNVVVSIEDITTGKQWDLPTTFEYDQQECVFVPHIMIVQPKTAGVVLNSDSVVHNVHTISKGGIFNVNKSVKANTEMTVGANKLRKAGIVKVKCDMHYWMSGWWVVVDNPYVEVSGDDGRFLLEDIPAGTYKIKIWHEKLGEREQSIEVKAGETARLNVKLAL